jgi:chaperone required for assembly of F1-ATPase
VKRFYKTVDIEGPTDGVWRILLDGRPVRTPGRVHLDIATDALAEAIAAEWRAQSEKIDPNSMPLTSLASTAADRVGPLRGPVTDQLLGFVQSDMVCYRADSPRELVARQDACWQPLVDWLEQRFDARLTVTSGVMPVSQPEAAGRAVRAALAALDDDALTAVSCAAAATGSLVLALALIEGRLDPEAAIEAAHLDELWQAEQWGSEDHAVERRAVTSADIVAAARYHALSRPVAGGGGFPGA